MNLTAATLSVVVLAAPPAPRLGRELETVTGGRSGAPCSFDRHCAPGYGCDVPRRQCASLSQLQARYRADRRFDLVYAVPFSVLGLGALAGGAVLVSREQAAVGGVALGVGSLLTLMGLGSAVAIAIKARHHNRRLRQIRSRAPAALPSP